MLLEKMSMALGGRAAEAVIFNQVTTGASDDLRRVTKLAYDQICSYGLSDRIGHLSFRLASESGPTVKPYSKQMQHVMDQEAQALVAKAYQTAENILKNNMDKLNLLAESLLKSEFLTYNHMVQLIGPPPHGKKSLISSPDEEIPVTPDTTT